MKYIIIFPRDIKASHQIFDSLGTYDSICMDKICWLVTLDDEQLTALNLTYIGLTIYRKIQ